MGGGVWSLKPPRAYATVYDCKTESINTFQNEFEINKIHSKFFPNLTAKLLLHWINKSVIQLLVNTSFKILIVPLIIILTSFYFSKS